MLHGSWRVAISANGRLRSPGGRVESSGSEVNVEAKGREMSVNRQSSPRWLKEAKGNDSTDIVSILDGNIQGR